MDSRFSLPELEEPYCSAIAEIRSLAEIDTPHGKFEQISKIKRAICRAISDYCSSRETSAEMMTLDPDNLLSILTAQV